MVFAGTAAKALGLAFAVTNVALIAYSHPGALTASGPGNGGLQKAACALRASSSTAEHPNETRTLCYHFTTQLGSTARNGPGQYGTLEPNSVTNPVLVGTLPPLREAKSSTAKQGSTPIAVALITGGCQFLQLAAELAIERIRTAAAQRDGKAQQPPQQHIFVTAAHPAESIPPIRYGNEQHLDGGRCGKKPGEKAEDERDAGECLDAGRSPKPESRRIITEVCKGFENGVV